MTWDEAIKISIKHYFDKGDDSLESSKFDKDRKYNKAYLDRFEDDILSGGEVEKPKTKKSKVDSTDKTEKYNKGI